MPLPSLIFQAAKHSRLQLRQNRKMCCLKLRRNRLQEIQGTSAKLLPKRRNVEQVPINARLVGPVDELTRFSGESTGIVGGCGFVALCTQSVTVFDYSHVFVPTLSRLLLVSLSPSSRRRSASECSFLSGRLQSRRRTLRNVSATCNNFVDLQN